MNYVGRMIADERARRGWRYGDLARAACGAGTPRQISKVSQQLVLFEREGVRDRSLLAKVAVALDLDPIVVDDLLRRQHEEELARWREWLEEPVPMTIHLQAIPGFWVQLPLPPETADDELEAIEYTRELTVGGARLVVLALNRKVSLTFANGQLIATREATPDASVTPYMLIGGKGVVFELSKDQLTPASSVRKAALNPERKSAKGSVH